MGIIVLLILISLAVALAFLFAFFWAVSDGQFKDDVTPAMRMLIDDGTDSFVEEGSTVLENEKHN